MFKKIATMFKSRKHAPKHIAITINDVEEWASKKNIDLHDAYKKCFEIVNALMEMQIESDIRIVSVYVSGEDKKNSIELNDAIAHFFSILEGHPLVNENQVKISVLGKWYDLSGKVIEPVKKILNETKDYDNFFLNFCINYDGQEEIVDACKLLARQIKAEKIDADAIDKNVIKDNLYSSYFLPPDIIIVTGKRKSTNGFLLWDSKFSEIYFTEEPFPEFSEKDFEKAIG